MNLGIKNKTALVTGSSRGIGKSCAISLSKEGANVVICGRDKKTLTESLSELKNINENTKGIVCDISTFNL